MSIRTLALAFLVSSVPTSGYPCSAVRRPSANELVKDAEAIVLVRAEGLSGVKEFGTPTLATTGTQVRFRILEILKGEMPAATIELTGTLTSADDRNDRPVPYDFVRPAGRHGNCYALEYRQSAEYVLLLKRQAGSLTPHWAPLAPTNEQVFGATDPWLAWIRKAVAQLPKR